METARVAVALVRWERELASSDREPLLGVSLDLNYEPNRPRIAGCRSRGLFFPELRFEPPAQEANRAYDTFPRRRSARWRRLRSNESRRVRSACVNVASRTARCLSHLTRSVRVI
jgi:hypothetical protein